MWRMALTPQPPLPTGEGESAPSPLGERVPQSGWVRGKSTLPTQNQVNITLNLMTLG